MQAGRYGTHQRVLILDRPALRLVRPRGHFGELFPADKTRSNPDVIAWKEQDTRPGEAPQRHNSKPKAEQGAPLGVRELPVRLVVLGRLRRVREHGRTELCGRTEKRKRRSVMFQHE